MKTLREYWMNVAKAVMQAFKDDRRYEQTSAFRCGIGVPVDEPVSYGKSHNQGTNI
ncbi:MAG: hypothetical protein U5R06_13730 [candidate division KSB1 bacterium]|nr:hypothetical protein [candidate division KSB1 bacterium]